MSRTVDSSEIVAQYEGKDGWIYLVTQDGRILVRSARVPNMAPTLVTRRKSVEEAKRTARWLAESSGR